MLQLLVVMHVMLLLVKRLRNMTGRDLLLPVQSQELLDQLAARMVPGSLDLNQLVFSLWVYHCPLRHDTL
jgi:hypothetical protein